MSGLYKSEKKSFRRLCLLALFGILISVSSAHAAGVTGKSVISLVIPSMFTMAEQPVRELTVVSSREGNMAARITLCLKSNLTTPLRVTYAGGQTAKSKPAACSGGNTGASFTAPLDASRVHMTIEPL